MAGTVGDVVVRPAGGSGDDATQTTRTLPASLAADLAGVEGVARADGNVTNFATFVVGRDGKVIGAQGAPGLGLNYHDAPAGRLTALAVDSGRVPQRAGEVALDPTTADKAGYRIGDDVRLVSSGAQPAITARLVGLVGFGNGGTAGASMATFDTRTAQQLFVGGKDVYTDIWVTAEPGTSQAELRDAVAGSLPSGFEAVTGDQAADEAASDVNEAVSFIGTFLLVFAGVALVVGSFLIVNTFSILVAQRSREARAVPGARLQPSAGDAVGGPRGARDRPRRLDSGPRARLRPGARDQGALRDLRPRPLGQPARLRAVHRGGGLRRGADRDARGCLPARSPGRAHRAHGGTAR